ncbi:hypothetical protein ACFVTJ_17680 [Agrobacterium sp. NPDC058088]|uniref:hypothetical protein n=1 Tax=Agrobacterium sp. NPDC058088 TaxID=3346335 RepID=UPI0036DB79D1
MSITPCIQPLYFSVLLQKPFVHAQLATALTTLLNDAATSSIAIVRQTDLKGSARTLALSASQANESAAKNDHDNSPTLTAAYRR